jgi:hypothetical protein
MYKEQIFDRATDVRGNKFKGYSANKTKWASILARKNDRKKIPKEGLSYGEAKRMGILKGQWAGSKGTTAPVLTQGFKNNLRFRGATANQFKIGWSSRGGIVNHLADLDRIVTEDRNPFPKDVVIEIERQVKREMQRHKDMKSKHHKIVLGK